jgi:hypothetical protein
MNRDRVKDWWRDRRDQLYANRYYWRAMVVWPVWFSAPQFIGGFHFAWPQLILVIAIVATLWNVRRQRFMYICPRYYFYRKRERDEVPINWMRMHPQQDQTVRYLKPNEQTIYGAGVVCVSHVYLDEHLIAKLSCPDLVPQFEVEQALEEFHQDFDDGDSKSYVVMSAISRAMSKVGLAAPERPPLRGGHMVVGRKRKTK